MRRKFVIDERDRGRLVRLRRERIVGQPRDLADAALQTAAVFEQDRRSAEPARRRQPCARRARQRMRPTENIAIAHSQPPAMTARSGRRCSPAGMAG